MSDIKIRLIILLTLVSSIIEGILFCRFYDLENKLNKLEKGNSIVLFESSLLDNRKEINLVSEELSVKVEGYKVKQYSRSVILDNMVYLDDKVSSLTNIVKEGTASKQLVNLVGSFYLLIPENVRNSFESNGYMVVVTSENFGEKYGYNKSILALFDSEIKTVYIDDRLKACKSILHEMGHYIDNSCNFKSLQEEFNLIWLKELNSFKSIADTHQDNYSTSIEYFAEAFSYCITDAKLMKKNCPETYWYIMNLVSNFK